MDKKEAEFYTHLLETFKIESEEHLKSLSEGLLKLEALGEVDPSIIEVIFRDAHSLKGAARAVNLSSIQSMCQSFENVMAGLRHKTIPVSQKLFKVLYKTVDLLTHFIQTAESDLSQATKEALNDATDDLEELTKAIPEAENLSNPEIASDQKVTESSSSLSLRSSPIPPSLEHSDLQNRFPSKEISPKTIRIAVSKLDRLLLESEEMLMVKLNSARRLRELNSLKFSLEEVRRDLRNWKTDLFSHEETKKEVRDWHGSQEQLESFFKWIESWISKTDVEISRLVKDASQDVRLFGGVIDNLLEDVKKILMQPFSNLTESFPRMVRDLSQSLGKEVRLELQGGEIEIDRRILEDLKDPLIHLIRNSIDHGIEEAEQRIKIGKAQFGKITISATQAGGNTVEIVISDDGGGIDAKKIKQAAVKSGAISEKEASQLTENEAQMLIFRSGVSTSQIITEVSGRGLGMGIVAEKVEKLGGQIIVESRISEGSSFKIVLPLTIATFRGIEIKADHHHFIIPTANVKRVICTSSIEMHTIENRSAIHIDNQTIPVVSLKNILNLKDAGMSSNNSYQEKKSQVLILLNALNVTVALTVDEIIAEQEIFVKGLGNQLARVKNITAATVTEWGTVVPILDPFDLVKTFIQNSNTTRLPSPELIKEDRKKIILVVEDSITARIMLQNILESAGYIVKTAVDGVEGFSMLQVEEIDLIVSDVEMPRLNGFELVEKIRGNDHLKEKPVILCTSRGSREDKERGIEVGANAYIDKNNFVQDNLLDLITRLL